MPISARADAPPAGPDPRSSEHGQALTELALIVPLLLILLLGIADFARLYTTMLTVESAAREAADYGAFYSRNWEGDPTDPTSNFSKTVVDMEERACVAASSLPDYSGSGGTCANPAFAYELQDMGNANCADKDNATPCRVKVTLTYVFHLFAPLNINFFNVQLGLPSTLTFQRDSTFAISDFKLDQP